MMKIIFSGLLMLAMLASCNKEGQQAPEQIERTYALTGFTQIDAGEHFAVTIKPGSTFSIKARGTAADLDDLLLETDQDHRLVIRYAAFKNGRYRVTFDVTLPLLTRVRASGVSQFTVRGFDQQPGALRVSVSGRAALTVDGLPELLKLEGAETGVANLFGSSHDLIARLSGESRLNGYAASFADADVVTESKAKAWVSIRNYLSAIAAGESRIHYKGNPPGLYTETSGKAMVISE